MAKWCKFGALPAVLWLLSACSSADYAQPVTQFGETTQTATKALTDLDHQVAQASLDFALDSVARDKAKNFADTAGKCGSGEKQDCNMAFTLDVNGEKVTLNRADYTSPLRGALSVMEAMSDYATALDNIVKADTVEKVQASLDSATASITALVKTYDAGANLGDLPTAAGEAVKWVAGQYIESVKIDALRTATAAAKQPIAKAEDVFDQSVKNANTILLYPLEQNFKSAQAAVDHAKQAEARETAAAYVIAGNALADAKQSEPAAKTFYKDLIAAHTKLADALNGTGPVSLQSVGSELAVLGQRAQDLYKIVQNLRDAVSKIQTPKKPA